MDQIQLQYSPISALQLADRQFPLSLQVVENTILMGMSDYSLKWLDLNTQQILWNLPEAHKRRIHQVIVEENITITCSNDRTIKLFDLKSQKLVKQFNCSAEIFSIAKSKHILAAGSEDKIEFFDLNQMKWRSRFDQSQNEEISGLKFRMGTQLLACSTDGLLVTYDLSKANEEEALLMMIRFEQPLNTCGYWGTYCYCVSTTNQIIIIDMEQDKKLYQFNANRNDEFNNEYLIGIQTDQQFSYFLGQGQTISRKTQDQQIQDILHTNQNEQIRQIVPIGENYLLFSENGFMEILTKQQYQQPIMSIEQEAMEFIDDEELVKQRK